MEPDPTFTNHQQFHQYQQSEQPPLPHTIEHTKTTMHSLGNPVLGHAQTCGRVLSRLMGFQALLTIWYQQQMYV